VLFVGDSWGAGHNATDGADNGWVGIPFEVVNLAIDGSTAQQWAADANGWLTRAANQSADVVVISLLGNDAFVAFTNDGQVTADEIAAAHMNLRTVVERFTGRRIIVLLYAVPQSSDWRVPLACAFLNGSIKAALTGLQVEWADTGTWLTPAQVGGGMPPHPTADGWQAARIRISELIEQDTPI
jgi:hypothetical protein